MNRLTILLITLLPLYGFSQTIGIPYRAVNKWGLADTSGRILIEPRYDTIFLPKNTYPPKPFLFYTKRDGLTGVIYQNKEIIPPKLNYVRMDGGFIVNYCGTAGYNQRNYRTIEYQKKQVYNFKGQNIFNDTIRHFSTIVRLTGGEAHWVPIYQVVLLNGKEALVRMNFDTESVVKWIIPSCDQFVVRPIQSGKNVQDNSRLRAYDPEYETDPYNVRLTVQNNGVVTVQKLNYNAVTNEYTLSPNSLIEQGMASKGRKGEDYGDTGHPGMGYGDKLMDERSRAPYKNPDNTAFFSLIFGDLQQHIKIYTRPIRGGEDAYLALDTVYHVKLPPYDDIRIVKYDSTDGNWNSFRNLMTGTQVICPEYVTFTHNGLVGIVTDNHVTPAQYQMVKGIRDRFGKKFIVGKYNAEHQLKYGIINEFGVEILPTDCDTLIFNAYDNLSIFEKFIMVKNGKWYLMGYDFKPLVDVGYDSIIQPKGSDGIFNGYLNGKVQLIGVLNYAVSAMSPWLTTSYQIVEYETFDGYRVWHATDKEGKFRGFIDSKGFSYFRE